MTRFQPIVLTPNLKPKQQLKGSKINSYIYHIYSKITYNTLHYTTKFKQPLQLALQVNCIHY
jgi:hypothetical protein